MKPRLYACLAGLCVLAACAERANGPVGAPIPSHPEMTFVDADGCSWWVIGNATSYSWARHTNSKGEHVCSEESELPAVANNGVPFVTEDSPEPKVATTLAGSSARFVQVATFAERANAVAAAYQNRRMSLERERSNNALDTLQKQLKDQSDKVEEARLRMLDLAERYRIIDLAAMQNRASHTGDPALDRPST